jgi:hypothetical protein
MHLSALREKVNLQYAFDQSDYRVAPGGTVAVTVSIQEVFSERSGAALFAPGAEGLIGAGVLVRLTGTRPAHPARLKSIADIKGNWHFDFALMPQLPAPHFPDSAGMLELATGPVFGKVVSRTGPCQTVLLPLATFIFTAGPLIGEVTHLTATNTVADPHTPGGNNVTASGTPLDGLIRADTATITVSPKAAVARPAETKSDWAELESLVSRVRRLR